GDHQHNSTHQRDPAQNRRNRHRLLLLMRDLQRPQVDILLFVMEAEASHRKPDDPKQNQNNSNDSGSLHKISFYPVFSPEMHLGRCSTNEGLLRTITPGVTCQYTGKEDDLAYEI